MLAAAIAASLHQLAVPAASAAATTDGTMDVEYSGDKAEEPAMVQRTCAPRHDGDVHCAVDT